MTNYIALAIGIPAIIWLVSILFPEKKEEKKKFPKVDVNEAVMGHTSNPEYQRLPQNDPMSEFVFRTINFPEGVRIIVDCPNPEYRRRGEVVGVLGDSKRSIRLDDQDDDHNLIFSFDQLELEILPEGTPVRIDKGNKGDEPRNSFWKDFDGLTGKVRQCEKLGCHIDMDGTNPPHPGAYLRRKHIRAIKPEKPQHQVATPEGMTMLKEIFRQPTEPPQDEMVTNEHKGLLVDVRDGDVYDWRECKTLVEVNEGAAYPYTVMTDSGITTLSFLQARLSEKCDKCGTPQTEQQEVTPEHQEVTEEHIGQMIEVARPGEASRKGVAWALRELVAIERNQQLDSIGWRGDPHIYKCKPHELCLDEGQYWVEARFVGSKPENVGIGDQHVGLMIEVHGHGTDKWLRRKFRKIDSLGRYVCQRQDGFGRELNGSVTWLHARPIQAQEPSLPSPTEKVAECDGKEEIKFPLNSWVEINSDCPKHEWRGRKAIVRGVEGDRRFLKLEDGENRVVNVAYLLTAKSPHAIGYPPGTHVRIKQNCSVESCRGASGIVMNITSGQFRYIKLHKGSYALVHTNHLMLDPSSTTGTPRSQAESPAKKPEKPAKGLPPEEMEKYIGKQVDVCGGAEIWNEMKLTRLYVHGRYPFQTSDGGVWSFARPIEEKPPAA